MLNYLIQKYKRDDVTEVVYKLSYGGKFIIVKAKTLSGSLYFIQKNYRYYSPLKEEDKKIFYWKLYRHYEMLHAQNRRARFTVKVIAQTSLQCSQYDLLVAEQTALDSAKSSPAFIGTSNLVYIPKLVQSTGDYGWLSKEAVMSFKRYLDYNRKSFFELADELKEAVGGTYLKNNYANTTRTVANKKSN